MPIDEPIEPGQPLEPGEQPVLLEPAPVIAYATETEIALPLDPKVADDLAAAYRASVAASCAALIADETWRLATLDANVLAAQLAGGRATEVDAQGKQDEADAKAALLKAAAETYQTAELASRTAVATVCSDLGVTGDYNVRHDLATGTIVVGVSVAGVPLTAEMVAQGVPVAKPAQAPDSPPAIPRDP